MSEVSSTQVFPIGLNSKSIVNVPPKFIELCRKLDQDTLIALLYEEASARNQLDDKVRSLETAKSENVGSFETLFRKIDSFENKFKFFTNNLIRESITSKEDDKLAKPKTYAEKVAENIPLSRPELILATREAIKEEQKRPDREKSLVSTSIPTEYDVKLLPENISEVTDIPTSCIKIQPFIKNRSMVLVKFTSKEHVAQVFHKIKDLRSLKNLDQIRIRPDYSPSELALYRNLWSRAIVLNNKANAYEWTVHGLQLVKLENPRAWEIKVKVDTDKLSSQEIKNELKLAYAEIRRFQDLAKKE